MNALLFSRARAWCRALALLALLVVAAARPARAQAGMPDMSHAPADVQAIWHKVMSGGVPTPAEAQKLRAYMMAHQAEIVAGARAQVPARRAMADSMRRRAAAVQATVAAQQRGAAGDSEPDCPAKSPALARVAAMAPSAAGAAALLDTLRRVYAAAEGPAGVRHLDEVTAKVADGSGLSVVGSILAGGGYGDAAVLAFVAAARRGDASAQLAWTGLGGALEEVGDDAHAVAAFRRALASGTRGALDVYGLGVAYADLGGFATALPLLEEATRLAPRFAMAWDALGRTQSCAGMMIPAVSSMARAQEVDWSEGREAQTVGRESNDDAVEAKRPLPTPSRVAFMPPPTPKPFVGEIPVIPDSWQDSNGWPAALLRSAVAYQGMINPILQEESAAERAVQGGEVEVTGDGAGGIGLVVDISNTREAVKAVDRVQQRMSGRVMMMQEAYAAKDSTIDHEIAAEYAKAVRKYDKCRADVEARNGDITTTCEPPFCRDSRALMTKQYDDRREAARIYIGGIMGTMTDYDRAMRGWFMFADDPVARLRIDAQRRSQLAGLEQDAFTGAAVVGQVDERDTCVKVPPEVRTPPKAKMDSAADPGKCVARKFDLHYLTAMAADCEQMKMSLDLEILPVSAVFEFRKATKGHHGMMFIGVGKSTAYGLLSGEAGLQANFDEGDRITTAGIGLHGSVGNDAIMSASAEETINLRSTGPLIGDGDATVAMSPEFKGAVAGAEEIASDAKAAVKGLVNRPAAGGHRTGH